MNHVENAGKFYNFQYLLYFITRSFLLSILCFICFITMLFIFYFVDLSFHYDNPLFGAYVIVSPSMVPTIKINDAIVIRRVDHDDYNVGDIITFSSSDVQYRGVAVTHRIVDKVVEEEGKKSRYTTKGDNNTVVDPAYVKTDDIYGRVLFKIPKIGYIKSFLSKPTNFFLCLLIPVMMFFVYEILRIFIMLRPKKKG